MRPAFRTGSAALTTLAVASFLGFGALLVLYGANASELIAALELDYAELGFLGSMLSLGLGVGIVLAGPIIDRAPRRPLYLGALAVVVASTLSIGPQTTFRALIVHTLALGFGAGFYETVLNALIVEAFGERAPRRLVLVHAAATAAASATPLVFEGLRELAPIAWYDTFRIVGASHLGLAGLSLFVPMPGAPRRAEDPARRDRSPGVPDDRAALAAICMATFAYVGVEAAVSLFVADHVTTLLGLDAARAARAISAFWGGLLVGRLAIGLAPRPIGTGVIAAVACGAVFVLAAYGLGAIAMPELAMTLVGLFLGGVFPVMIGMAGLAMPSAAGLAVGLAGGLGSLGGFVVPWITGRLANATDLGIALASLAAWLLALVAATAFVAGRTRTPRPVGDPAGPAPA